MVKAMTSKYKALADSQEQADQLAKVHWSADGALHLLQALSCKLHSQM